MLKGFTVSQATVRDNLSIFSKQSKNMLCHVTRPAKQNSNFQNSTWLWHLILTTSEATV